MGFRASVIGLAKDQQGTLGGHLTGRGALESFEFGFYSAAFRAWGFGSSAVQESVEDLQTKELGRELPESRKSQ